MRACVFTLGCKMNEVESASLMQGLEELGYEVTDTLSYADVYVLNTCAVTAEAEKKSRQAVARVRKCNPSARIVVCGCASHNHPQAFAQKAGVTLVTGARRKDKVLSLLREEGVFPDGEEGGFDGVSLIEFDNAGKIVSLKEFQSKAEHIFPYENGKGSNALRGAKL